MMIKKTVNFSEEDLLRVEQIIIDRDKDWALDFIKEVINQQADKDDASKMKREKI